MKKTFILLLLLCSACLWAENQSFYAGSFNLRYANEKDSLAGNGWGQRLPVIAGIIQFHDLQIFGTQEALQPQLNDLSAMLPGYEYIGVGRDDGKEKGEHSCIFYRKDLFEVLEHGDFWMSETPDHPSKGWDAALPRICTWGHFRQKSTGKEFLFFNLHMDHKGKKARVMGARLVKEKMKEVTAASKGKGRKKKKSLLPSILTGDFNVDQTHDVYAELTGDSILLDAYQEAAFRYAPNGTVNAWTVDGFTQSRIDHVFVTPAFQVLRYGVLTDTYRIPGDKEEEITLRDFPSEISSSKYVPRTPSDHFPVKVEVRL